MTKDIVLQLLHEYPETRDNDGELAYAYLLNHFNGTPEEFIKSNIQMSLERYRRMLQNEYPELKGNNHEKRQAHAKKIKVKIRQQEKPENWFTKLFA